MSAPWVEPRDGEYRAASAAVGAGDDRREVIIKPIAGQLRWAEAAKVLKITARHMRRIRPGYERWGMSAVIDQRGGRPQRERISMGTIETLCRLKREVYAEFSVRHFFEQVSENHQVGKSGFDHSDSARRLCNSFMDREPARSK